MPFRMSRYAGGIEIRLLMTDRATHGRQPMTVRSALDRRLMQSTGLALERAIARGMTVDAARVRQHLAQLGEQGR